jgi:hypothetical protein
MNKVIDIGYKVLRDNTELVENGVLRGDSFVVSRRSKRLFKIVPLSAEDNLSGDFDLDFSEHPGGGIPADTLVKMIENILDTEEQNGKRPRKIPR